MPAGVRSRLSISFDYRYTYVPSYFKMCCKHLIQRLSAAAIVASSSFSFSCYYEFFFHSLFFIIPVWSG